MSSATSSSRSSSPDGSSPSPPRPHTHDGAEYITIDNPNPQAHMACLTCRARKTRCDGVRPRCGHCSRLDKACTFGVKIRKPRKPRTEVLEEKIRSLETKIEAFMVRDSQPSVSPRLPGPPSRQKLLSHRMFLQESGEIKTPPRFVHHALPYFPHAIWVDRAADKLEIDPSEPYSSVIRREFVEEAIAKWDMNQALPHDVSEHLIRIFLPYRSSFLFQVNLTRFLIDLRRPATDPRSIHPGLLNVIYVFACSQAGGYLASFESHFLTEARRELEQSLAFADRLQHWLWANLLLGIYYAREGRALEAYTVSSSLVRFAVGCELHKVAQRSPSGEILVKPDGLLPPPDDIELEERISLWCAIYLSDRILAKLTGMHSAVPSECIPMTEPYQNVGPYRSNPMAVAAYTAPLQCAMMPAAQVRIAEAGDFDISRDNEICLRLKMGVLYEGIYALQLVAKGHSGGAHTVSFRQVFKSLESSINEMQRTLPSLQERVGLTANEVVTPFTPILFWVQGVIYSCAISLYSIPLFEDDALPPSVMRYKVQTADKSSAYAKRLAAALNMAKLSGLVCKSGKGLRPIHGGIHTLSHTFAAADVLARELVRDGNADPVMKQRLEEGLEALFDFVSDLTRFHGAWYFDSLKKRIQTVRVTLSTEPADSIVLSAPVLTSSSSS